LLDGRGASAEDEAAEAEDALETLFSVDYIEILNVGVGVFFGVFFEVSEDITDSRGHREGEDLIGHQAAGAVPGIAGAFAEVVGFLLVVNLREDGLGVFAIEFAEKITTDLGIHFHHHVCGDVGRKFFEELNGLDLGKVREEFGRFIRREKFTKFLPGFEIKLRNDATLIIGWGVVDDRLGGFEIAPLDGFGQALVAR